MNRHDTPPTVVYEGKYQRMVVRGTWEYSERVCYPRVVMSCHTGRRPPVRAFQGQ